MKVINLVSVGKLNFQSKKKERTSVKNPLEHKNDNAKFFALGAITSASVVAGLAIAGKFSKAQVVIDETSESVKNILLKELQFNKGVAVKGDELFTGVAEHINKKGDKFLLEYKYGRLLKSKKNINLETGVGSLKKGNFIKTYSKREGKLCVSQIKDTINGVKEKKCEISKDSIIITYPSGKISKTDFKFGKPSEQELANGTKRVWHDGKIFTEKLSDGTRRMWHENGQIASEFLPGKTSRTWYKNGQIESEYLSDKDLQFQMCGIEFKSEKCKCWFESGELELEKSDGITKKWRKDGVLESLRVEGYNDYSIRFYKPGYYKVYCTNCSDAVADLFSNGMVIDSDYSDEATLHRMLAKAKIEDIQKSGFNLT